ncbi:metallophosphoesterase [Geoglobus sp.]
MRFSESGALKVGKNLIVSDIHLGILGFPDFSLLERILDVYYRSGAERLVLNGDIKHRLGRAELKSVERFIRELDEHVSELILIKGNHDGLIDEIADVYDYYADGKLCVTHGHKEVKQAEGCRTLIVAHAHPAVFIQDVVGGIKERAWMIHESGNRKCVVMPAFNELCSSTAVNVEKPAGFVFDRFKEFDVFTISGYYFGKVRF